jgi:hypothetical protein
VRNNKKSQIIHLFKRLEHFELFSVYQLSLVGNPSKIFSSRKGAKTQRNPAFMVLIERQTSSIKSFAACMPQAYLPQAGLCGFARKMIF